MALRFTSVLLFLPFLFSGNPVLAVDNADIVKQLETIKEIRWNAGKFLDAYGIEVVRETNFEMSQEGKVGGSLKGQLGGQGWMLQLGNLSNLITGVAQVGSQLSLHPFGYPAANVVDNGFSNLLRGLDRWGAGKLDLSGEIRGEINGYFKGEGHGVKINDEPNVFWVIARTKHFEKWAEFIRYAMTKKIGNEGEPKRLLDVMQSPAVLSQSVVDKLKSEWARIPKLLEKLESDLLVFSKEPAAASSLALYSDALKRYEDWFRRKRLMVIWVQGPSRFEIRKDSQNDNFKSCSFAVNEPAVDRGIRMALLAPNAVGHASRVAFDAGHGNVDMLSTFLSQTGLKNPRIVEKSKDCYTLLSPYFVVNDKDWSERRDWKKLLNLTEGPIYFEQALVGDRSPDLHRYLTPKYLGVDEFRLLRN